MTKQRVKIREARAALLDEIMMVFDGHACDLFTLTHATGCLLCEAWRKRLVFALYEMLHKAGLVHPNVQKLYEEYCAWFPSGRPAELLERERHKMLGLPWVTCNSCGQPSQFQAWQSGARLRGGTNKHIYPCPSCLNYQDITPDAIANLYKKQKTAYHKQRISK